jgi:hypothetical protein
VVTRDNQSCGKIIGTDKENIVVKDGAISQHLYLAPKSAVEGYNEAQITLNLQYNESSIYEDKVKYKGTLESITDSIKDIVKSVKDNTLDKVTKTID